MYHSIWYKILLLNTSNLSFANTKQHLFLYEESKHSVGDTLAKQIESHINIIYLKTVTDISCSHYLTKCNLFFQSFHLFSNSSIWQKFAFPGILPNRCPISYPGTSLSVFSLNSSLPFRAIFGKFPEHF